MSATITTDPITAAGNITTAGPITTATIEAGLPHVLAAPKDAGALAAIFIRPASGTRGDLPSVNISRAGGVAGDRWVNGCWVSLDDGSPHPDLQVSVINARFLALIAQDRARWALAGDNLVIDMDLTPENLPSGTRLAIGAAVIEISDYPHFPCADFAERYGRDATVYVARGRGRELRLRGRHARVVTDGRVNVGDKVVRVGV
ncbi:MAG: MOSC domain-containing protein [Alphaproteobacteria bacterium]